MNWDEADVLLLQDFTLIILQKHDEDKQEL